jgi:hypothetical protein
VMGTAVPDSIHMHRRRTPCLWTRILCSIAMPLCQLADADEVARV